MVERLDDPEAAIPKIVHIVLPDWEKTGPVVRAMIADQIQAQPDHEFWIWSDEACDALVLLHCTKRQQDAYFSINRQYGPAIADFARYVIMYVYGGEYHDAKSGFVAPEKRKDFHPFPPLIVIYWGRAIQADKIHNDPLGRGEICNWYLMSAQGHDIWQKVLNQICDIVEHRQTKEGWGVGKQQVLEVTGPIMMTICMNEELRYYHHVKVRAYADIGVEYDILGGHQKLQSVYGSQEKHYTKLTTGIVMQQPRIPLVQAGDLHLVLKINPSQGAIGNLWDVPLGTTVKTENTAGTVTQFVQGRHIRHWVDKAFTGMIQVVSLTQTLVTNWQQVHGDEEQFEKEFPGHKYMQQELHTAVQDLFISCRLLGVSNWNFSKDLEVKFLSTHSKNIVRALGFNHEELDFIPFMNGWVRAEFIYDSYMVTELTRMKKLNRPIMKDNQYGSMLKAPDQLAINNMVNMIQDKLRLNDQELHQVQETLVAEQDEGQKISEEEIKDFLEPYDPENMGAFFVCPNAANCGQDKKRNWKSMMDHAWNNQETAKKDPEQSHLKCYDAISKKDKLYYDRVHATSSKKGKAQPVADDESVMIRPTYAPMASLELLKTLQDAHRS